VYRRKSQMEVPSLASQISESRVLPTAEILRLHPQLKKNARLTPQKCNEYLTPIETKSNRCLHVSLLGGGFRVSKTAISLAPIYKGKIRRHTASGFLKMNQLHSSSLVLKYSRSVPNRALIYTQATKLSSRP
jgi:hypothetical protein